MNESEQNQAMRSAGVLDHEIPAGKQADRAEFDRLAYAVGRQVLAPDVLREIRAPLIEAIIADGHAEPVEGEPDRFRWTGDPAAFETNRQRYRATVQEPVKELLINTGAGAAAIETMWGRRALIWTFGGTRVFAVEPSAATRWHRDGWMMMGHGAPGDHVNLWIPLTRLEPADGPIGIAVGSHRLPMSPQETPRPFPLHLDVQLDGSPPDEVVAPLWATTRFDLGDAIVFDPYVVHSTVPNDGSHLRLAIVLIAQDAGTPVLPIVGLSGDTTRDLIDDEWLSLAIATLQPSTVWQARCVFYTRGIIARLTGKRSESSIHDAFKTLQARGLIEAEKQSDDDPHGMHHTFHPTPAGRELACEWLANSELTDPGLLAVRLQFCTWLNLDTTSLLSAVNGVGRCTSPN